MATLDLSKAKSAFSMTDPDLVRFGAAAGVGSPNAWSYLTPGGDKFLVGGQAMQFDAAGRATAGTVTSMEIDIGNNGSDPDLVITGISVAAAQFHNDPNSFWRFLEGDDVILGPELAQGASGGTFNLFGDGVAARPGADVGGRDIIHIGDGSVAVDGDVENVGSPIAGAPTAQYRGGNDEILGLVGDLAQTVSGDASRVYGGSRLDGGDDSVLIQSKSAIASAVGDAYDAAGNAIVIGGDDYIAGGKDFQGKLVGDVFEAHPQSRVEGGDDRINGGDLGEYIVGDVYRLRTGRLVGGDDTINGGGGNDIIAGDAYAVTADATAIGGADLIHAGGGNDEVYGDAGYVGQGGDDRIYGDSGIDRLHGEGGADMLDGGTGSDRLYGGDGNDTISGGADNDTLYGDAGDDLLDGGGGADVLAGLTGNDTYFVNDPGDIVYELAGFGADVVWSTLGASTLAANVEILRYNGVGNFTGIGNNLDNTIAGSAGVDTASYASATTGGVDARLTGNSLDFGGDARGDTYSDIENLSGSAFDDNLHGDDLANTLSGEAGGDNLFGFGGGDVLIGGAGDDRLLAKDGNDVLRGGLGADVLRGGAGNDVFDFDFVTNSAPGARDVLAEDVAPAFEGAGAAAGDRIDLAGIDANTTAGGNQAFVFGGAGLGRISAVNSGADTLIRCNVDKDAAFEFELLIEDGAVLASAYRAIDFYL